MLTVLPASGDDVHLRADDPTWVENLRFGMVDPVLDVALFVWARRQAGGDEVAHDLAVWLPDGAILTSAIAPGVTAPTSACLSVECVDPGHEWLLSGELQATAARGGDEGRSLALDLRFRSLTPPIGVPAATSVGSAEPNGDGAPGRLEQAGVCRGSLDIDGRRRHIALARGNRRRRWGPGGQSPSEGWYQLSGNLNGVTLGEGVHLGFRQAVGDVGGDAWVWRDGRHVALHDVVVERGVTGSTPTLRARAVDGSDRLHELDGVLERPVEFATSPGRSAPHATVARAMWTYRCSTDTFDRHLDGFAEVPHAADREGVAGAPA